ncbi:Ca-activated chloride channel family protein [Microlunatus sagamiharensis]|uniref:Ca-activated chloride channel family protein n=1 Tax=Microlunatus sagamiharensis TaxID=546874 RepID=A0A1H2MZI5_9ACTN|nr:VWA domain-containing protein [Microlunatus sagamiharensis]SDU98667.1 Ca-activated chloride channel family protein [Microlunatus sagamiharensis]
MTLAWPWALLSLLVVPLLLAVAWLGRRRRRAAAVRVTSIALVREALPPRSRRVRLLPPALLLLGLVLVAVAAARPQARVPVASDSTTIMLAMDVSGSMCATDVEPNRLTVAQQAATRFIESEGGDVKIGLVAFAGVAGVRVAPTTDTDALVEAIGALSTARGTAIGSAILTSVDAIALVDPTVAPSGVDAETAQRDGVAPDVVVVLTDGANTQGPAPATAAEAAAVRGLRVFTIGFGTTSPTRMACTGQQAGGLGYGGGGYGGGGFGGGGGGRFGGRSPLVIDEPALQGVAETTGGQYYRAENADQLAEALGDLPTHVTVAREDVDVASWFAGAGGLLVATALGLSLWWGRVRRFPGP